MTDKDRKEIDRLALDIMDGVGELNYIHKNARKIHEIAQRSDESPPVWTPCADGLPEVGEDVIISYDANGIYNTSVGFMGRSKTWYLTDEEQSQVKVLAWQPLPDPYNPDHIRDTTKKVDQFREPTKMMQNDM